METNPRRDIIVIGGSAGALQVLEFIADLPSDLQAAIFIVIHVAPQHPSLLPSIIRRYSPLPVETARDREPIQPGRIYVASPDQHLMVRPGVVRVVHGPKENRHRPSIDVLLRSAAEAYGQRVIALVLSGTMDDGAAGLIAVRSRGGIGIVQEPGDAQFPDMPRNALKTAGADHVLPKSELGALLARLASEEIAAEKAAPAGSQMEQETAIAEVDMDAIEQDKKGGEPSVFGCPDCGGVLWEIHEDNMLRFRCRVGHALTAESLLAAQSDVLEEALWSALVALEEKAELAQRLMAHSIQLNHASAPEIFGRRAKKAQEQATVIRRMLTGQEGEIAEKPDLSQIRTSKSETN